MRRYFFGYKRKVVVPKLRELDQFLNRNEFNDIIFIDCGANDGFIANTFMKRYKCYKSILIEPQFRLQGSLRKLQKKFPGVEVLAACISSNSGILTFVQQNGGYLSNGGGSSYVYKPKGETTTYIAPAIGIMDLIEKVKGWKNNYNGKIAVVMKIDIEGAERSVLPILENMNFIPDFIFCEFHDYTDEEIQNEINKFNSKGTELEIWI